MVRQEVCECYVEALFWGPMGSHSIERCLATVHRLLSVFFMQ